MVTQKKHIFSKWSAKNGKGLKVVEVVEFSRDIVSSKMFMLFTFACFPVLMISLSRTFETGWQPVFYFHITLYCIISIISIFRKYLSITFRAITMLIIMFLLGIADLLQYGLCSMGFVFLSIFCLNTPIMFGKKWGMTALSMSLVSILIIAILAVTGLLQFSFDIYLYATSPTSWLTALSVFSVFLTMPAVGMAKANQNQLETIDALDKSETLQRNLFIEYKQAEAERKKAEEERKRIEAQLRQSHKMQSIGTLAGGIAHDFNNILGAVIGYSEMTLCEVEKGSVAEHNLTQINLAGRRAKELVNQILKFARQTEETMMPVNVGDIACEVLTLLRSSFPSSIKLNSDIDSKLTIMGNPTQLHQVFMNLCTNAFHAIENMSGFIDVNVSDISIDAQFDCISYNLNSNLESKSPENSLDAGDYVRIRVSDTGAGIPSNIIHSIFEPYFTTKKPDKGSGIGLSVVHGIVKKHCGEITVQSELGRGTIFTVYLPALSNNNDKNVISQNESVVTEPADFISDDKVE
ncbi:MAG: hypothetical protein HQK72_08890 [Desulfamplus sp.]|nr:hypothetical protein [Desulfamplus sp.]